ncbi:alpha/beta fold hydrolase [Neptunicoccus cionae]|uniref:Hydrolase n=1 Tax=Neptunicoccus cionae TaxID=2035344 RepID=A0A916QZ13_9RHOB|nr:alpha/beta hydrolase [Amylibacter cionae]GGA21932.1 hydrolase [Amylibacter cionae]
MTWTIRPRSKIGALAAITAGEGPLVVLIHGVGLRAEAWGAQIDALAKSHRVVAVDMPGHGKSARLAGTPTLAAYTDRIAEVIDGPATVIGHSFGAMIALDLAIRYRAKVSRLAALNAIYHRSPQARQAVLARADSLDGESHADPAGPLERWFGPTASTARSACEVWLRDADPAGYRDAYRVFAQENGAQDDYLRSLPCPALFLTGGQEPNSTPAMSQQMAALVPHGRAEILPDAAHMAPMTHGDDVNRILTDFMKEA